jgi:hypothetical protein
VAALSDILEFLMVVIFLFNFPIVFSEFVNSKKKYYQGWYRPPPLGWGGGVRSEIEK